jgi:hypothetical protein
VIPSDTPRRVREINAASSHSLLSSYLAFILLAYFPYFEKNKKFWEELIAYFP